LKYGLVAVAVGQVEGKPLELLAGVALVEVAVHTHIVYSKRQI